MKDDTKLDASLKEDMGPGRLFDLVMERFSLENDRALARMLDVSPSLISKTRNLKMPVTADLLLRLHEETEMSIRDIKSYLGKKHCKAYSRPYIPLCDRRDQHAM